MLMRKQAVHQRRRLEQDCKGGVSCSTVARQLQFVGTANKENVVACVQDAGGDMDASSDADDTESEATASRPRTHADIVREIEQMDVHPLHLPEILRIVLKFLEDDISAIITFGLVCRRVRAAIDTHTHTHGNSTRASNAHKHTLARAYSPL